MDTYEHVIPLIIEVQGTQGTHHVHQVRGFTRDMVEQAVRENHQLLDEMESGNNFGAFPFGYIPCNTLK